MTLIILHPEQKNLPPIELLLRNKDIKELFKMQYSGGFKRFGISIIDDKVKGKKYSDHEKLGEWLGKVFLVTQKTEK